MGVILYDYGMVSTDTELRALATWTPGWRELAPIENEITKVWKHLKELRVQAADLRLKLSKNCPISLDDLEMRFWTKVVIVDDETSCWKWNGASRNVNGEDYGLFKWKNPSSGKHEAVGAHRVAFLLTNGYLPEVGRHTCDNPICVRPSHIIDGTHLDNMRDRHERGRYGKPRDQRGEQNASNVLTEEIVREARRLYVNGLSDAAIGKRFEVSGATIGFAIRGRSWAHITDPPPVTERRKNGGKLTATQVEEMKKLRAKNVSLKIIAEQYGVSASNVSYMTKDKTKSVKRPKRKLTDEEVRSIRELRARNVLLKDVAVQYGISVGMVSHIVNGRAYQHVK